MNRNRRRGSSLFGRIGRMIAVAAVITAATGLGAAATVRVARWAAGHPYFAVREVAVEGTSDPVTVTAWAGIEKGKSLWSIDPERSVFRLLAHPRIRIAEVRREFPDRVEIIIEERRPLAVLMVEAPLFLDEEGAAFPPRLRESLEGYPCVTGFRVRDLSERPAWVEQRLRQTAKLLRLWHRYGDWPEISEVRPEGNGEIVVFPMRSPMTVRFGREVNEEQFARLSAVFGQWRGRESEVAGIDLSVPGQAVLRLRRSAFPAGRRVNI